MRGLVGRWRGGESRFVYGGIEWGVGVAVIGVF